MDEGVRAKGDGQHKRDKCLDVSEMKLYFLLI